jgi:hypothetical protein
MTIVRDEISPDKYERRSEKGSLLKTNPFGLLERVPGTAPKPKMKLMRPTDAPELKGSDRK